MGPSPTARLPSLLQDAYSKRFVPVACISRVAAIGDQKFEVITNNRTFAFRAESDGGEKAGIRPEESGRRAGVHLLPPSAQRGGRAAPHPQLALGLRRQGVRRSTRPCLRGKQAQTGPVPCPARGPSWDWSLSSSKSENLESPRRAGRSGRVFWWRCCLRRWHGEPLGGSLPG